MQPEDILKLTALNSQGQPVPLSAFASTRWITGPMQTIRYNGYPAMRIAGAPRPATAPARRWPRWSAGRQLPEGFGYEWTGQSREEKLAGNRP
jgi:multidrug efflux pump